MVLERIRPLTYISQIHIMKVFIERIKFVMRGPLYHKYFDTGRSYYCLRNSYSRITEVFWYIPFMSIRHSAWELRMSVTYLCLCAYITWNLITDINQKPYCRNLAMHRPRECIVCMHYYIKYMKWMHNTVSHQNYSVDLD